jgi:hypothetical protein
VEWLWCTKNQRNVNVRNTNVRFQEAIKLSKGPITNRFAGGEPTILNRSNAHPNRAAVSPFCQGH